MSGQRAAEGVGKGQVGGLLMQEIWNATKQLRLVLIFEGTRS